MGAWAMRHSKGRGIRSLVFIMLSALIAVTLAPAATARQGAQSDHVAVGEAREVRTVWTGEFGVDRPTGLAYDMARQRFLVAGDQPDGTNILRLDARVGPAPSLASPHGEPGHVQLRWVA